MLKNQTSADSYYAATAHPAKAHPALDRDIEVDVAIVGGGFTGVASALSLAERGFSVAIADANQVGWGASGRNGGQVLAGWSGDGEFAKQVGAKAEEFLWRTRYLGNEIIEARLKKYAIECDYTLGAATVALNARQMTMLEAEFADCAAHGQADMLSLVDDAGIRRHVGTTMYCGGLIDCRGGRGDKSWRADFRKHTSDVNRAWCVASCRDRAWPYSRQACDPCWQCLPHLGKAAARRLHAARENLCADHRTA